MGSGFLVVDSVASPEAHTLDRPFHFCTLNDREMRISVPLRRRKGVPGTGEAYLAALGIPMALEDMTPGAARVLQKDDAGTEERLLADLLPPDETKLESHPASPLHSTTFLRGSVDTNWTIVVPYSGREGTVLPPFSARVTVLGEPGTELIRIESLAAGWGHKPPFVLARRRDTRATHFVAFVEPSRNPQRPALVDMRRVPVLPDSRPPGTGAIGLDLVFAGTSPRRYRVIVNTTGQPVRCGDTETDVRWHCRALTE
jgi:hypothetical protein